MKQLLYSQIICFFQDNNILFDLYADGESENSYQLASIKNIIRNGIYYLNKEIFFFHRKLFNSIILTNVDQTDIELSNGNIFVFVDRPQENFYRICQLVKDEIKEGIHETAIIDKNAKIGQNCYIGPYCIIGNSKIGNNCKLESHIYINKNVQIGDNTSIESFTTIGATGTAWIWDKDGDRVVQPQFGGVTIENDCFIGSNVTIVRGSVNEDTYIGEGTMIAHGTKIGHGCYIEKYNHFANNVSLAGSVNIGERCFWGSGSIAVSHIKLGKSNVIGAGSVITKSFNSQDCLLFGNPAKIRKQNVSQLKLNGVPNKIKEKKNDK